MSDPRNLPDTLDSVFREIPGLRVQHQGERRIKVEAHAQALPSLLGLLKGRSGYLHLSAISCIDWPEAGEFELAYHLWSYETKVLVSVHVRVPKEPGIYVSVYDIHQPAGYFERDIHEMFGLLFEGAPDMRPFILTEWDGPPPMLKSFDTLAHVNATFAWQEYRPEWLKEIEAKGGGLEPQE